MHEKYFKLKMFSTASFSDVSAISTIYDDFNSNASGPNYFTQMNMLKLLAKNGFDADETYVHHLLALFKSTQDEKSYIEYEDWFTMLAFYYKLQKELISYTRTGLRELEVLIQQKKYLFQLLATRDLETISLNDIVLYIRMTGKSGTYGPFIFHQLLQGKQYGGNLLTSALTFRDFVFVATDVQGFGEEVEYLFAEERLELFENAILVLRELFVIVDIDGGKTINSVELHGALSRIDCSVDRELLYKVFHKPEYIFPEYLWNMARLIEAGVFTVEKREAVSFDELADAKKSLKAIQGSFDSRVRNRLRVIKLVGDRLSIDPVVDNEENQSKSTSYSLNLTGPARASSIRSKSRQEKAGRSREDDTPEEVALLAKEIQLTKIKCERLNLVISQKKFDNIRADLDFSFDFQRIIFGPLGVILWYFLPLILPLHLIIHRRKFFLDKSFLKYYTLSIFVFWLPAYLGSVVLALLSFRHFICSCLQEVIHYTCSFVSLCSVEKILHGTNPFVQRESISCETDVSDAYSFFNVYPLILYVVVTTVIAVSEGVKGVKQRKRRLNFIRHYESLMDHTAVDLPYDKRFSDSLMLEQSLNSPIEKYASTFEKNLMALPEIHIKYWQIATVMLLASVRIIVVVTLLILPGQSASKFPSPPPGIALTCDGYCDFVAWLGQVFCFAILNDALDYGMNGILVFFLQSFPCVMLVGAFYQFRFRFLRLTRLTAALRQETSLRLGVPYFGIDHSKNINAFLKIRFYVVEILHLEEFLRIKIALAAGVLLIFLLKGADILAFLLPDYEPPVPVTLAERTTTLVRLYDASVLSVLCYLCLSVAMKANELQNSHRKILLSLEQEVALDPGPLNLNEAPIEVQNALKLAQKKCTDSEPIRLFGFEITSGAVANMVTYASLGALTSVLGILGVDITDILNVATSG